MPYKQMHIGLLSSFISTRLRCFHLAPPSPPSKLTTWCSIFYYLSYLLWIPNKSLSQTSFIASFYLISTHKIYSHGHDYDFYYKYYIVLSFRRNLCTYTASTFNAELSFVRDALLFSWNNISMSYLPFNIIVTCKSIAYNHMYLLFLSVKLLVLFWLSKSFIPKAFFKSYLHWYWRYQQLLLIQNQFQFCVIRVEFRLHLRLLESVNHWCVLLLISFRVS